jgi:hypothetical protein
LTAISITPISALNIALSAPLQALEGPQPRAIFSSSKPSTTRSGKPSNWAAPACSCRAACIPI